MPGIALPILPNMATLKFLAEMTGDWSGSSELHMSWLEEEEQRIKKGPASVEVELDPSATYAKVNYIWTLEGELQHGSMIVASDESGSASAGWVDSWHMSAEVMAMKGTVDGSVNLLGSYKVEGHPDWGWRIELRREGEELLLLMFNIGPDGTEEWAVRGTYRRA
jgi:hypothetical protein